ncbi:MAG: aldo/keto reductase [Ruminococcus sp.]|nr:aldo/keto reductase [Ruminococcus sp.]
MKSNLPNIGFGTWKLKDNQVTTEILNCALDCGYELIDTASSYQNEKALGAAVATHERENIWLSGKLWNTDRNNVEGACDQTIQNLNCNYLDLYLMHWPASKAVHDNWAEINAQIWKQMERLVVSGKTRHIGVSNFKVNQLEELISGCSVKPFVNQIEYHPGFMQNDIVEYCKANDIIVQAWSPLRSGRALKRKDIIELAEKYGKTPAQIILKWCIQNDVIPIVKSTDKNRMKSNLELNFTISSEDMDYINNLPYSGSSGLDSETLTLFG